MAARAGSAAPRAWTPLDSSGTPVVWCFHGRVPDSRLVVVDKSRQRLLVLRYLGKLLLEYEYPCATGERSGPKSASSDEKTPEGIYFVTHRYHDKKITIFGDRALHINYPNPHDQIMGRQGNGIYIHGTNRAYKPRSSNGCLVMANPDLARVEPLLNEQFTPVILMERMALPQASLQKDACEFLRTVKLALLNRTAARLPSSLDLLGRSASKKTLQSLVQDMDRLGPGVKADTKGLALLGVGRQWVLLARQEFKGPDGKVVRATRRYYLAGDSPRDLSLVQSQWVVADMAGARLLASWAPPKPVAVAAVRKKAGVKPPGGVGEIEKMLSAWLAAWQGKHLKQYMAFYAPDFRGSGKSRGQWRRYKAHLNRVYKKITVQASDVKVKLNGQRAQVSFLQRYRSDWHRDVGVKHLELVFRDGRWLIRSESWQKLPARGKKPSGG
jgi:murein L,D-transpeptidase YafK